MCSKLVLCFILSCGGMVCCFNADEECKSQHPQKTGTMKAKLLKISGNCSYTCTENDVEVDSEQRMKPDDTPCADSKESKVCLSGQCVTLYDIGFCQSKLKTKNITVVGMVCMVVCGIKDDDSKSKEYIRPNAFPCKSGDHQGTCKSGICHYEKKSNATTSTREEEPKVAPTPSTSTTAKPPLPIQPELQPSSPPTSTASPPSTAPTTSTAPTNVVVHGTAEPSLTTERNENTVDHGAVSPVSNLDVHNVDITSLCKEQYRSAIITAYPGNSTYGCMYFCFYESKQLNIEPFYSPDEAPCGGKIRFACSGGFCQRKIDIKMCKYYYRNYVGYRTKVTGYRDMCFFKCEANHEYGSYEVNLAVKDDEPCKTEKKRPGKCFRGSCT